ncbi:MAG TPA: xanthine dehydrogenase family protein molybdopterin-binding subunit [Gemmatimonadaceae bacterium]|nr:xanthine dehydrogenase family protein molybdopterin-binding subunit [Gemmatimonadaceae bacterium]
MSESVNRVDGRLKVTGGARYAAEYPIPNAVHAVLVTSTIAKGRVVSLNTKDAERVPGVLAVLTPHNAMRLPGVHRGAAPQRSPTTAAPSSAGSSGDRSGGRGGSSDGATGSEGSPAGRGSPTGMRTPSLLQDDAVHYNGQPIGVVVADTFEHATAAAHLVTARYLEEKPVLDFATAPLNPPESVHPLGGGRTYRRGDVASGLAGAAVTIDETYTTPLENHNPMEVHNTVAVWDGDQLTLYESTQGISSVRGTVAQQFDMPPDHVRVISYFTGGGFGSKGGAWSHETLAAMAAKTVNRPVKLVLTRRQMFGPVGGRAHTTQRVTLGATHDGALTAVRHASTSNTSTLEDWVEPATTATRMLYASPNLETSYDLKRLNVGSPTFMRAPGESTGTFALESAMDELAYALRMDPIALRLKNYAEHDEESGRPWSSKSLRECYSVGAEQFGWSKRTPAPRSMRDGRWLVGWGMATATYPARTAAAGATATLMADGTVVVRAGTQEIGCGTYTVMSQIVADALAVPLDRVRFELGNTDMPENPASTGSVTAASTGTAVHAAALALKAKIEQVSPGASVRDDAASIVAKNGGQPVEVATMSRPGAEQQRYSMHSFGAVFTEVRVDPDLGVIRVPRVVTAHGVGQVLNEKTARSQIQGGVIWGIGMALLEKTEVDPHSGRYVNADLAEYHVPVNADVGTIDVHFVDERDANVNPLGVKGAGEIGITGVAASIANAVYHATGRRVRDLPIRIEQAL